MKFILEWLNCNMPENNKLEKICIYSNDSILILFFEKKV
jgi:hypothetical protein